MKRFRVLFAGIAAAAITTATWPPFQARADIPVIVYPFGGGTISTTATSGTLFGNGVTLLGQARCTINLVDTVSATVVVTGTGDGSNYLTNTSFGSSGTISVTTTQSQTSGDVSLYPRGFNATISANAGTLTFSLSCGPAQTAGSGGSGGSVSISNTPGVVVQNTLTPVTPSPCPSPGCVPVIVENVAPSEPNPQVTTAPSAPAAQTMPYDFGSNGAIYPHTVPDAWASAAPIATATPTAEPVLTVPTGEYADVFWAGSITVGTTSGVAARFGTSTSATCSPLTNAPWMPGSLLAGAGFTVSTTVNQYVAAWGQNLGTGAMVLELTSTPPKWIVGPGPVYICAAQTAVTSADWIPLIWYALHT